MKTSIVAMALVGWMGVAAAATPPAKPSQLRRVPDRPRYEHGAVLHQWSDAGPRSTIDEIV